MSLAPDRPRPSLARQLRAAAALLLILAVVAATSYGVYWLLVGRPLLAGVRGHDFGWVEIDDEPVELKHTFELTNRTGRSVEIRDIRTSCGCTVATPRVTAVKPGETTQIDATLTLRKEGRKEATIYLRYDTGAVDTLHVEASARKRKRLYVGPTSWALRPGKPIERAIFYLDYESNDTPPVPRITAPPGVEAGFGQWSQLTRRRRLEGKPAHWQGWIDVSLTAGSSAAAALLRIELGPDQKLEIPLASLDR